jgi:hypothetical protein
MTPEQQKAIALAKARARVKAKKSGVVISDGSAMRGVMASLAPSIGIAGDMTERARTLADPQAAPPTIDELAAYSGGRQVTGRGEALLRGASQGATFGGGDEVIARIMSLRPDMTYEQALEFTRQGNAQAQETRPGTYLAGNIAGGAIATVPLAGVSTIGGGVKAGAAIGATQGFLSGEGGLQNRLTSGAVGGAIGGVIGGAIPAVAQAVGAGVRHVKDWASSRAAAGQIGRDLGVSPQAATLIRDSVGSDDAALMAQNIRDAGPDAMLADAGPSVQGALDASIQRPGAAARTAMTAIEKRAAAVMSRINTTLDNVLGKPQGQETAKGAIRAGTQGARSGAYEAAYNAPINYAGQAPINPATTLASTGRNVPALAGAQADPNAGPRLLNLLPRIPAKVVKDANLLMQIDGNESRQIMAQVADDGSVKFTTLPDVRQWDYIKRALDLAAESGEGQGALGGQTSLGRAYVSLAREVRDTLKEAVPEYGQALETAADAIRRVKSVDAGYTLLRAGTTREAAREAVKGLTGAERAAMKQGVRDYIDDALANVRAVISDPNLEAREARKALGELTSRAAKEKIRLLLGEDAGKLFTVMAEAEKALGLRAAVAQNSKTFARTAYSDRAKELAQPGVLRSLATARPVAAVRGMLENVTGSAPEAVARRSDRLNAEVAGALTRPGQQNALAALAAIEGAARRYAPNPSAGRGVQQAIGNAAFPLLAPTVNALRTATGF